MFALSIGGILALVALVVCSSRGYVLRGMAAGALILALGAAELLLELTALFTTQRQDNVSVGASAIAGVAVALQILVMAVAISKQAPRPRRR